MIHFQLPAVFVVDPDKVNAGFGAFQIEDGYI